jgi:hypothetical protein
MGIDKPSMKTFYPLPLVTEEALLAVQLACRQLLPETDVSFVCIRNEKLRGDQVTAVINAVLPDLPVSEPVLAGRLDRAIDLYLAFELQKAA